MGTQEKSNVLTLVEETQWGKQKLLTRLQVAKSTSNGGGPVHCKGSEIAPPHYPDSRE